MIPKLIDKVVIQFINQFHFFVSRFFSSPQTNYTSPWQWTTVTATGEWHGMEARKEPNSSNTSYLPTTSDFHHFHHLMNNNGGHNLGGSSSLGGNNHNGNNTTAMKQTTASTSGTSITATLPSSMPPLVQSHAPQSSSTLLPVPLPPTQQHTTNTSLSSRQLPFPYNMNNYHSGGY